MHAHRQQMELIYGLPSCVEAPVEEVETGVEKGGDGLHHGAWQRGRDVRVLGHTSHTHDDEEDDDERDA